MTQRTMAIETLGCKVNQFESSYLIEQLEANGYRRVPFDHKADLYIVHSCAVTAKACYQTRQMLRRARRTNPRATIAVIGCNAQLEPQRLAADGLATHILGTREKLDLVRWLQQPGDLRAPLIRVSDTRNYQGLCPLPVTRMMNERARAFLKVQDGCNAFCSYCVIPWTRGRSRSLPRQAVRAQLLDLIRTGYQEVVLTGIHLGQWGRDLRPAEHFVDLLRAVKAGPAPPRIRLSSLEPREWNQEVLETLSDWPAFCPHFHVPLQSGDREILQRMGRPYTPEQYREVVERLRALYPRAAIGADVLVGFPGETERHFQNTLNLVQTLPLSYLHVFPYSPRPGTRAAQWKDRVTGDQLKDRAAQLRRVGEAKRDCFQQQQLGTISEVLVEAPDQNGGWRGTSRNYLPVHIQGPLAIEAGARISVRLTHWSDHCLHGTVTTAPPASTEPGAAAGNSLPATLPREA